MELFKEIIIDNEEILKSLIGFLSIITTGLFALAVSYYTKKTPEKTVKLEQLRFIGTLAKDKAWKDRSMHFVIEEAFKNYFGTFISINIIKHICISDSRFHTFEAYGKISSTIKWSGTKKMILVPNKNGVFWYKASQFGLALVSSTYCIISFSFGYAFFKIQDFPFYFIQLVFAFCLVTAGIFLFYLTLKFFDKAIVYSSNLTRFKMLIGNYVETSEVDKQDKKVFTITSIILALSWAFVYEFVT